MKISDIIFGLICGRIIGFLVGDFIKGFGVELNFWYQVIIWLFFPFLTVFCLWIAFLVGRKIPFAYQASKFALIGIVATIIDLRIFEGLVLVISLTALPAFTISKIISFFLATTLKYWGNKHWTFGHHEKEDWHKEVFIFFLVTLIGVLVDVLVFRYVSVLAPQIPIPTPVWIKISVIIAGFAAAVPSFLGYKFLVFKK